MASPQRKGQACLTRLIVGIGWAGAVALCIVARPAAAYRPFDGTDAAVANLNEVEITHINLNDQTLEGFRSRNHPVFCVQYHPEAAPGPHDSHYLFDDFTRLMREAK